MFLLISSILTLYDKKYIYFYFNCIFPAFTTCLSIFYTFPYQIIAFRNTHNYAVRRVDEQEATRELEKDRGENLNFFFFHPTWSAYVQSDGQQSCVCTFSYLFFIYSFKNNNQNITVTDCCARKNVPSRTTVILMTTL